MIEDDFKNPLPVVQPPVPANIAKALDPFAAQTTNTFVYERFGTIYNTTVSSNQDVTLRLPQTAPTRIAAVQVSVRLEVLSGTGRLLCETLNPQGDLIWSFSAASGSGPQQDTALWPMFSGGIRFTTDGASFGGAYTVGVVVFVSGYLRAGL